MSGSRGRAPDAPLPALGDPGNAGIDRGAARSSCADPEPDVRQSANLQIASRRLRSRPSVPAANASHATARRRSRRRSRIHQRLDTDEPWRPSSRRSLAQDCYPGACAPKRSSRSRRSSSIRRRRCDTIGASSSINDARPRTRGRRVELLRRDDVRRHALVPAIRKRSATRARPPREATAQAPTAGRSSSFRFELVGRRRRLRRPFADPSRGRTTPSAACGSPARRCRRRASAWSPPCRACRSARRPCRARAGRRTASCASRRTSRTPSAPGSAR